ncbi:MAG: hypothetical protein LCH41_11170 [Armatimonadetes bacterium]|nr:hypothetical protein [Armatimonadota bacterium]
MKLSLAGALTPSKLLMIVAALFAFLAAVSVPRVIGKNSELGGTSAQAKQLQVEIDEKSKIERTAAFERGAEQPLTKTVRELTQSVADIGAERSVSLVQLTNQGGSTPLAMKKGATSQDWATTQVEFVLVGTTPAIYATLDAINARDFPLEIVGIEMRAATNERASRGPSEATIRTKVYAQAD